MRAVLQRVAKASVLVGDELVGAIDQGLVVFVGVGPSDSVEKARVLADKTANLRIFSDEAGKFNLSALSMSAEMLVISQFTLYADASHGRRPSFVEAAPPEIAAPLVDAYAEQLRSLGLRVATGRFGAHMLVQLVNDGPVTILLEA
ncbi:MAG: D-aminoacyl-tRNA deacylase [Chloroflexi bacterium]|nr:D-aminoacyl-tRNA deacylase [Chloroflexota bacterium]MCL5107638.1 D-aminoacyl-tRNA deacylase [Chloroflexota bacterium]